MTRAAALMLMAVTAGCAQPPADPRVAEIAKMLPAGPAGIGRPLTDRATWDAVAKTTQGQELVKRAADAAGQKLADQPDDLYLEYSRNGNRTRWQTVAGRRRGRIDTLTLGECVENKGRFIKPLEETIAALCAEKCWVMPAHDGKLDNFNGKVIDIDLASSALAWRLATTSWLLGDKLSAATRGLISDNVARRVTGPYRDMVEGRRGANWWVKGGNNWNAVCHAGTVGAALCTVEKPADRALYIAAAEQNLRYFLNGFTPDGYCTEGLGYWNYGFGNYVDLAETVYQATSGKVDWLGLPAAKAPAHFGAGIEIADSVYPAFADCSVNAQPSSVLMAYLNRRFDLGAPQWDGPAARACWGDLVSAMLYGLPNSLSAKPSPTESAARPLRTWFDNTGILISRPAPGSTCLLGVALKGGNNAEQHNHNDVGSYVVEIGGSPVLLDPGAEVYTARTFSSRRYESNLLNSFGHAVPRVAGRLQEPGAQAKAKILATEFGDQQDTYRMDIASCYKVPELTKLERTFVYSRAGAGQLTVTDTVAFSKPQEFGTAMITAGSWRQLAPGSFLVGAGGQVLAVSIKVEGAEFATSITEIKEESSVHPKRLGIDLSKPVSEATITMTITPGQLPGDDGRSLLKDGSFETAEWFWTVPADNLAKVEDLPEGGRALHITDDRKDNGTNVTSSRMAGVQPGDYVLSGRVKHIKGSGIGMYVYFLDAGGQRLNPTDGNGNIQPVGSLEGAVGQWVDFRLPFKAPAGTTGLQLWIHSYSAATVEAWVDNLAVTPGK